MLQGYNAMQMQLGLMPGAGMQPPMGVPLGSPLPPPQVMSPGQAALQAFQIQNDFSNQTFQAAQMTRYVPPPSAPVFAPPPSFGGGFGGGGFGGFGGGGYSFGGSGAPGPSMGPYAAPAQMFRGYLPQFSAPFQPAMPSPHFMTPTMQSYGRMQARQADYIGTMSGAVGFGMEALGGVVGGALGSVFGPLGTAAGSFIGQQVFGTFNPAANAEADIMRGRQIQNMTAPFMVSGPNLNPFTGTGMDRASAERTARTIRTMVRDPQFRDSTGFNTQDIMNLSQAAAEQGLLTGAQSPEQIAGMVKNISKSVKALMQITGDPDFRNVMAQLGQMKQMGFEGLAAQHGAVANRATFARMAGVSQAQMAQMESAGAMQAMQMGLSGSTGVRATQFGAGMANVAVGSGAVGGLELSRAGGQAGLAQSLSRFQMNATQFDPALMAAVEMGPNGMGVNMDVYRRNMTRPLSELMQESSSRMSRLSPQQLLEFERRRGEFGERTFQQMSPTEQMLAPLRQAQALMAEVPGLDLGSAFRSMGDKMGMSRQEAQAMASVYSDPRTYRGLEQQLRVQQREARGRAISRQEMYATPGTLTQIGRMIGGAAGRAGDIISMPFEAGFRALSEDAENAELAESGEHITRISGSATISTERDRALARLGAGSELRRQIGAGTRVSDTFAGRRAVARDISAIYSAEGIGKAFSAAMTGNIDASRASAGEVSDIFTRALDMNAQAAATTAENVRKKMSTVKGMEGFDAGRAALDIASAIKNSPGAGGVFSSAKALTSDEVRAFTKDALRKQSGGHISEADLERATQRMSGDLTTLATKYLTQSGDTKAVDRLRTASEEQRKLSASYHLDSKEAYEEFYSGELGKLGIGTGLGTFLTPGESTVSSAAVEKLKGAVSQSGARAVALAAALGDETQVAELTKGMSETDRQALLERASSIKESFKGDDKILKVMQERGRGGTGDVLGVLTRVEGGLGGEKSTTAFRKSAEEIAKQLGVASLGLAKDEGSLMTQIASLSKEGKIDTSKITDPKAREAVEAFIGAGTDKAAQGKALNMLSDAAISAGTTETSITGGAASAEVEGYEKDIAELRKTASTLTGKDKGQAEAAIMMADAAKDLKDVAILLRMNPTDPRFLQLMGKP
jgi:hypothetical protein